ncbi:MAG: hypothetical protein M3Q46_08535, partial [Verrucomicrobiota bacterium]|nr:hypothetical protein [Verrucomicrobiota bacterium]
SQKPAYDEEDAARRKGEEDLVPVLGFYPTKRMPKSSKEGPIGHAGAAAARSSSKGTGATSP